MDIEETTTRERLPATIDPEEMLEWFAPRPLWPDDYEVRQALCQVGRNNAPTLLYGLYIEAALSAEAATACAGGVWSGAEYTDRYLLHEECRDLFEYAGYTVDGKRGAHYRRPAARRRRCTRRCTTGTPRRAGSRTART